VSDSESGDDMCLQNTSYTNTDYQFRFKRLREVPVGYNPTALLLSQLLQQYKADEMENKEIIVEYGFSSFPIKLQEFNPLSELSTMLRTSVCLL
jgi:hypothetical protein